MIIGEAPGAEEVRRGEPFVGQSGELLNGALEEIGRNRSEFYITNVYKHRPENNRNPTIGELTEQRHLLEQEFKDVNPSVVLVFGRVARDWLLPDTGGTMDSTRSIAFSDGTKVYLVTYHPSFILRTGRRESPHYSSWVDDIRAFAYY